MCTLSRKVVLSIICLLVPVIVTFIWLLVAYYSQDIEYIRTSELTVLTKCKQTDNNRKQFPRIIHRAFGFWDSSIPEAWKVSLNSCAESRNKFKVMLWNKTSSVKFLQREYPWFVKEFLSYRYPVQQADAARYFILHHYGGIYLDMDIKCTDHSSLSRFYNQFKSRESGLDAVLLPTDPIGITNFFVLTKRCSKFMAHSIARLSHANRWYVIPYLTVLSSTGPIFLSSRYAEFTEIQPRNIETIELIKQNQFWVNYFMDSGKHGTWHNWDAVIVLSIYSLLNLTNLFIFMLLILVILWIVLKCGCCRNNKRFNTNGEKHADGVVTLLLLPKKMSSNGIC